MLKQITTLFTKIIFILFISLFFAPQQTFAETLGTCTCSEEGELTYDTTLSGSNFTPIDYAWKALNPAKVFKNIKSDDCSEGNYNLNDFNVYRSCKFTLTKPEVTSLADEFKISEPILGLVWPGLNFTDADQSFFTAADGRRYLEMPWLAEFIKYLYTFTLGVVSIVAVVMIIIEGIQMILSGTSIAVEGFDSKTGEKQAAVSRLKNITRIMIGLFIAWTSYMILYQINPNLVKFQILQVEYIEEVDMPVDLGETNDVTVVDVVFSENWKSFPNISNVTSPGKVARLDLVEAFTRAAVEYGKPITMGSAGRSPSTQYSIMMNNCGCKLPSELPNDVPKKEWYKYCGKISFENGRQVQSGKCGVVGLYIVRKDGVFLGPTAGHVAGNAIDINGLPLSNILCSTTDDPKILSTDGVVNAGTKKSGYCIPKEQQILIGVMIKNGFCVGLNAKSNRREPWHFEYRGNELRLSGFCVPREKDGYDISNYPNLKKLEYIGI